jgi:hypothetical protein
VIKFGFADHLKSGSKTGISSSQQYNPIIPLRFLFLFKIILGEELAELLHTHPENTIRLMRTAAALGIFNRDPTTLSFSLSAFSNLLVDGMFKIYKKINLRN